MYPLMPDSQTARPHALAAALRDRYLLKREDRFPLHDALRIAHEIAEVLGHSEQLREDGGGPSRPGSPRTQA
jgi:hypothetical protein